MTTAITHYTVDLHRPNTPAQPIASLHVRVAPVDEVMCSLLPHLVVLHTVPAADEADYRTYYEAVERVVDFASTLQVEHLSQGWTSTVVRRRSQLIITTAPAGAAAGQGSTWLIRLSDNAQRSTVELSITATDLPQLLTGFIVAFTTAFPDGDLHPRTQPGPFDWQEILTILQWNIEDLADRGL